MDESSRRPWLLAEPHGGDGNDGCVRCSGTNVRPSQRPLPSVSTTAHSARRRRGLGEEYEMQYTAKFRKHSSPTGLAHSTLRSTTTTVCRSSKAPGLTASTRSGRRSGFCDTVEQTGDVAPGLPALDALVPQMVDQLEDVLQIVDLFVPAQEIEVPKISSLPRPPPRRVLPVPQTAEQLVDVPLPEWMWLALDSDAFGRVWTCVWMPSTGKLYKRLEIPRCSFWDGRRHARWCANDRIWSDSAENWFRSCIPLTRWSMSQLLQFIDKVWTSL